MTEIPADVVSFAEVRGEEGVEVSGRVLVKLSRSSSELEENCRVKKG